MRERVRRSVEIWWHKYGSVPTPNLVSEELVNAIALLFETPEGWPEPEWPQAAYDRIMVLEAEKQTLTKLNVGQAEELAEVRALVGIALERAAVHFEHFWTAMRDLEPVIDYLDASAEKLAAEIRALDPPAIAEVERRDARVAKEAIVQCAIEAGERSPEGVSSHSMLGDMWDRRIAALQATADSGEKESI